MLITTDIGGDPDDQQSLVRLLVHSNEFDIEGIIATASGMPGELDTAVVKPFLVREQIDAYERVYSNLCLHDPNFIQPDSLRKAIKSGNPNRGIAFIGAEHDTEGSEWIVQQIKKDDSRKLHISIWGGQTDFAQALWKLKNTEAPANFAKLISKVQVYDIADQDNIYSYIRSNFRGLFYILSKAPEGKDNRNAAFRGMYLDGNMSLTSPAWISENVKVDHGPLGALYPDKTWTAPNPYSCMKEGDTPSWFYFLENGLNCPENPSFGGWGGRFEADTLNYFKDAEDRIDTLQSARATVWRWRQAFQNDFAARMNWCVKSVKGTNHHPLAVVTDDCTSNVIRLKVDRNKPIMLDASKSTDPDGDSLSFNWWIYSVVAKSGNGVQIENPNSSVTALNFDSSYSGKEVHIILEVSDYGKPSLTAYRRIILKIN